jgi:hypothetical protein
MRIGSNEQYNVPLASFQRPYRALLNAGQVEEVSKGLYRWSKPRTIGDLNRRAGQSDTPLMDRCGMGAA